MANRMTDTAKWDDRWFRSLAPEFKLAWLYIIDRCDLAGVLDLDSDLANFQIGFDLNWEVFLGECGDRIQKLSNGKLWILKFIEFQQKTTVLNEANRFHKAVLDALKKNEINAVEHGFQVSPLPGPPKALVRGAIRYDTSNSQRSKGAGRVDLKPPSLEDVAAYCRERSNTVDPERFFTYYESQDWKKANGAPISNWKCVVVSWEKNGLNDKPNTEVLPVKGRRP